ncbi:MAG: hypothetical protein KDA75_04225 [Planctomycetaceae bacterium]|nr:hypothetical protein [Planctomycetaceae bacterium]
MQRLLSALLSVMLLALLAVPSSMANDDAEKPADAKRTATHKQTRRIQPQHNGEPIHLNTYCLSPEGNVLACVGGTNYSYTRDENGNYTGEQITSDSFVQVYNPDGDLTAEWSVPFKPTAINVAPDRTIFVSGEGKLARLTAKGEILTTANIPQIGDPEQYRQKAIEKAKAQNDEFAARLEKQMEFAKEQAAKIEDIAEEDRSASQKARLKAYHRQLELYQAQIDALGNQEIEIASVSPSSGPTTVSALAVSDSHVFVCSRSVNGSGFDVYRCDFDFQNPQEVLTGLRGCCGQMDIQARGDKLFTAENTRFQVGIYDEDGKELNSFGSRDRSGGAGFGSCCNPMNVRCCPNGDVLTAESSIGDIKRFSADGEYLGYVGRAKISGGCKHVALDWDEKRDRYYFMNVSDSSICVLVPLSEAPEFTEDELAAKAAQEGLGRKLVGDWKLPGTTAPRQSSVFGLAIRTLLGGGNEAPQPANANVPFERVSFGKDGKLTISGGMYGQWGVADWTWAAVRQDEAKQTVDFDMLTDGVQYQTFRCQLAGEDGLKISVLAEGQLSMTGSFVRDADQEQTESPAEDSPAEVSDDRPVETPVVVPLEVTPAN